LDEEEWARKKIPVKRLPTEDDQTWRSHQFHFIHQSRVRLVPGITTGNAQGQLSCSSCHRSIDPPDRSTPRTTCGLCHNGRTEEKTGRVLIAADKPNCSSWHVQHAKDQRHWGASLLGGWESVGKSAGGTKCLFIDEAFWVSRSSEKNECASEP